MSEPIRYVKDSKLFTVVIKDFESFMNGASHKRELGFVGGHKWFLAFRRRSPNVILNLFYNFRSSPTKSVSFNYATYITKHPNTDAFFLSKGNGDCGRLKYFEIHGNGIPLDELLNNGYLVLGALTIHVEIRVNAIIDKDGIRRFNFHDPFKGCVKLWNPNYDRDFFVGEQMISHHCPVLARMIRKREEEGKDTNEVEVSTTNSSAQFEVFLQLLHGVPLKMDKLDTRKLDCLLPIAHHFQVTNIFHQIELLSFFPYIHLLPARYAKPFMRQVKTKLGVRSVVKTNIDHLDEMSTEMLKAIIEKFFSFADDLNKSY